MTTLDGIATDAAGSGASAFDFAALIPLGAVLSVIGVLIAAVWAARSAMIVRLLDSQRAGAERFAVFQQDAAAAIGELGISMARFVERTRDAVRAAKKANPGATEITPEIDPEWGARVERATDAWRLVLARGQAFAGNGVHEALAAVDVQRALAIEHMNAYRGREAWDAVEQMREYEARQVYRRLQVAALEREIAMMRLVQTRRLRREMKRAEAFAVEQLERGEQMIADAERKHRNSDTPQTGA